MECFLSKIADGVDKDFAIIVIHGCTSEQEFDNATDGSLASHKPPVAGELLNLRVARLRLEYLHQRFPGSSFVDLPTDQHLDQELFLLAVADVHSPGQCGA